MKLNILLVEDDPGDMKSYLRDFPAVFLAAGVDATIHPAPSFELAYELVGQGHIRYDLILSDTFRGNQISGDAAVISMVNKYRGGRFCPLVVFSASAKPDALEIGAFVMWADKSVSGEIELAIKKMLLTGIPQLARNLHDELDRTAGSFLWSFLEVNWNTLWPQGVPDSTVLERLVRRRAAIQLAEMGEAKGMPMPVTTIAGLEYYIYPEIIKNGFRLGQIIAKRDKPADIRLILTPHCHLHLQPGKDKPRAEFVLTVKTTLANQVLGADKINNAKAITEAEKKHKKLKAWATPPSGDQVGTPEGRYWFLPSFLDIPHSYCDFQQVESISYPAIAADFKTIAVLSPPFAESLQACFVAYHAGVGIPNIQTQSIMSLLG